MTDENIKNDVEEFKDKLQTLREMKEEGEKKIDSDGLLNEIRESMGKYRNLLVESKRFRIYEKGEKVEIKDTSYQTKITVPQKVLGMAIENLGEWDENGD